jgi:hypothetical protein
MRHDNAHGVRGGLLEDSKDGAYNSLVMISLCLVVVEPPGRRDTKGLAMTGHLSPLLLVCRSSRHHTPVVPVQT